MSKRDSIVLPNLPPFVKSGTGQFRIGYKMKGMEGLMSFVLWHIFSKLIPRLIDNASRIPARMASHPSRSPKFSVGVLVSRQPESRNFRA